MNIKALREKKNLTQEELSSQTGIPRARLSKWEAGKAKPKAEDLRTLEKFFSLQDIPEPARDHPGIEVNNPTMQAILDLTYSSRKTADGIDKMADANVINARSIETLVQILAANLNVSGLKGVSPEALQTGDVPVEAFLGGRSLSKKDTQQDDKRKKKADN